MEKLIHSFEALLRRQKLAKPISTRIVSRSISVEDRMVELAQLLKYKKAVPFESLFESFDREYIIMTFLALLELVKSHTIKLVQENYYDELKIYSLAGEDDE